MSFKINKTATITYRARDIVVLKVISILAIMTAPLFSQDLEKSLDDLTFDDVMDIKVISFDGTPKKWKKTPAAIHVISKDDIAKSSARSVPDLLRGVPGLHVAQEDAHTWAISSRGFTRRYSNKLLVLVDGRSIYSPLFSGVHWELNDMALADIERIEVIRGPGGTLWGANAVNGIINIITKSSVTTPGNYLKLGGGNTHDMFGTYRFGEILDENNLAYRFTLNAQKTGHHNQSDGSSNADDWKNLRLSTRVDWEPSDKDKFFVSSGGFLVDQEREIYTITAPFTFVPVKEDDLLSHGYHLLTRWDREIDAKSSFFAQLYMDSYFKENPGYAERVDTYDAEFRYVRELNNVHKLSIGTGYRMVRDSFDSNGSIEFDPSKTQRDTFRIYGQDEITIMENELVLILGTKFERNDHTGYEWQPSAKLIWTPTEEHTFWGAVSRALKTPSRTEDDIVNRINFSGPTEVNVVGDNSLESERLMAYELGYRFTPANKPLSVDLTLFYHDYNHVNNINEVGSSQPITDDEEGYSMGGEAFISYQLTENWKVKSSYSYIETKFSDAIRLTGASTPHMASLMSEYDLTDKIKLFQNFYFVDQYTSSRFSYNDQTRLDLGVSWQVSDSMKLSAWGLNLLDPQTLEYADNESRTSEFPRSFYIQLEWNF